jgi:hypothetical protein
MMSKALDALTDSSIFTLKDLQKMNAGAWHHLFGAARGFWPCWVVLAYARLLNPYPLASSLLPLVWAGRFTCGGRIESLRLYKGLVPWTVLYLMHILGLGHPTLYVYVYVCVFVCMYVWHIVCVWLKALKIILCPSLRCVTLVILLHCAG